MNNRFKEEIIGYVISGILATITDYFSYLSIIHFYHNYVIAKMISFLLGSVVAFNCNKLLTFQVGHSSRYTAFRFFSLYILSMLLNVFINRISIMVFESFTSLENAVNTAFIVATFVSIVINFTGQKFWVFKSKG